MYRKDLGVYLAIISHGRPGNVARMRDLVGQATWFVREDDEAAYLAAGADWVCPSGGLCESRNAALHFAAEQGKICLQVSDDLKKFERAFWNPATKKVDSRPTYFEYALRRMLSALEETGAWLGGVAPTSNPFYANPKKPISTSAFIVGDFIFVHPDSPIRFDEALKLKEDYDFTLAHLAQHGRVMRRDDLLVTFQHRTNPGGAVEVRTAALEQESIAYLKAKWGEHIRDNPRRPNEILLSIPRVPRMLASVTCQWHHL